MRHFWVLTFENVKSNLVGSNHPEPSSIIETTSDNRVCKSMKPTHQKELTKEFIKIIIPTTSWYLLFFVITNTRLSISLSMMACFLQTRASYSDDSNWFSEFAWTQVLGLEAREDSNDRSLSDLSVFESESCWVSSGKVLYTEQRPLLAIDLDLTPLVLLLVSSSFRISSLKRIIC